MAAGNPLTLKQSDIGINGWAVEARVYAEVSAYVGLESPFPTQHCLHARGTHSMYSLFLTLSPEID